MFEKKELYKIINSKKETAKLFKPKLFYIPEYISKNLKHEFFYWQKEAFENLLFYENLTFGLKKNPTHLMFNMATGTGKTLLMAASILYFYKQGYRHFIFFVNQNNIIDKTENNFIDNSHTKYLFKEKIIFDDKIVKIKKVDVFSEESYNIEIKFTSIQKLYNDIHREKENQTTLYNLQRKNIVMLADEAHHLNADTKSKKNEQKEIFKKLKDNASEKDIEKKGWENTVIKLILEKNGQKENKNILLEFTATIPENENVIEKYIDKIIYKFDLKDFLKAGYTKQINLISSTFDKKDRILQALLFNWYRHKIALKNNISNFKSVILFRSKTINESKRDFEEFLDLTRNIKKNDFDFIDEITEIFEKKQMEIWELGTSRIKDILNYIKENKIEIFEIANFIRNNFKERNVIITNSKDNRTKKEKTSEEQEKLLNNLEDKNNYIRAIFTVDRLTEGWDVLNLFDIVRLYKGQNAGGSSKKTPQATIKEKQLIGRGVRYFPFVYKDKEKNKRKFDNDLKNELRIMEELYYHTYDEESRYISHLKKELTKDGFIMENNKTKTFNLKESFRGSETFKNGKILYNEKIDNPYRRKKDLNDLKEKFEFEYKIRGISIRESSINAEAKEFENEKNYKYFIFFKEIENHIFLKAISNKAKEENSLFQFENLKKEFEIETVKDLLKDNFFGNFKLQITSNKNNLSNEEYLQISLEFLEKISNELKNYINPKIGTDFIFGDIKDFFDKPKTKIINPKNAYEEIVNNEWYILDGFVGTSEEKDLIEFINHSFKKLEKKYEKIFLLKNEEVFKIYDFEKARGFQPDFILFLNKKNDNNIFYQIFIEPKGNQFLDKNNTFEYSKESWKENFLEEITERYGLKNIMKNENSKYKLIGLPFFNNEYNKKFEENFKKIIL